VIRVLSFVVGRDDKKAARILNAVGVGLAQDAILLDALFGAARVFDRIAPAAVQQAMIAPSRAVGEIAFFHQHHLEAAQGSIPRYSSASRAASNHENFGL
jgi:hypothetical protein